MKSMTSRSRLVNNGEDRGPSWGMASSASLPWGLYGVVAICTGGHPHIFYGHFPDAGWGAALDEGIMRRFFWQGA